MTTPTIFEYHELTDRVSVIEGMLHEIVSAHRVTKYHPTLKKACQEAEATLEKLVQEATALEAKHT